MYDVDMDKEKKCFDSRTRAGCGRAVSAAENPAYNFDSRTRVRCDKDTSGEWYISIHAPVWARRFNCLMGSSFLHFDSRTRVGCDCHHNHQRYAQVILTHAPA